MALLRVAAAVGALVWVAPHLPASVLHSLPEWKGEAVSAASQIASSGGQVLASQAVALCSQNPERCAALLSAAAPVIVPTPVAPVEKPRAAHARPQHQAKEIAAVEPLPKPVVRRPPKSIPAED